MKKNYKGVISFGLALLITAIIYVWKLFFSWGKLFFVNNFTFGRMVLPFVIFFFIAWGIIAFIMSVHQNIKQADKLAEEKKQQRIAEVGYETWQKEHQEEISAKQLELQKQRDLQIQEKKEARQQYLQVQQSIKQADANSPVKCPKCGSTQISADKKGFGVGKAVIGAAVAGPIGLVGGNIGAKKVRITCLKCGNSWMAGS